jgi:hypothetical protein
MVSCISEVDKNGFRVPDVEITIGLRWKPGPNRALGCGKVLFFESRENLWIFAWLMERA